ncbi:MAG: patatin-like phospholipase family protein [Planctomycetaceae bacterium]
MAAARPSWKRTLLLLAAGAAIPLAAVAATTGFLAARIERRLAKPPTGAATARPWGAIDLETFDTQVPSGMQQTIAESIRGEDPREFDRDGDGVRDYDFLTLSGGGAHGAFGAGMLCGWTERGDRPNFKVVTGISTGALQATPAFLGPDYDPLLRRFYTEITTADIYRKRSALAAVVADATCDTAPLRRLLDGAIDDRVLAAVAAKHRAGHRLFIGTANMDANEFSIWDMGAIAASGRPDARRRYVDVLVASASVPVLFPPVYFDVEVDGRPCREMHCDGGAEAQVFLRGFMLDVEDALQNAGLTTGEVRGRLFVIRNGRTDDRPGYAAVEPTALSIAEATIEKLFKVSTTSSLYRMYVLADRYGVEFNLRTIPQDFDVGFPALVFDRAGMNRLFDLGFRTGRDSAEWEKHPPDIDPDELAGDARAAGRSN